MDVDKALVFWHHQHSSFQDFLLDGATTTRPQENVNFSSFTLGNDCYYAFKITQSGVNPLHFSGWDEMGEAMNEFVKQRDRFLILNKAEFVVPCTPLRNATVVGVRLIQDNSPFIGHVNFEATVIVKQSLPCPDSKKKEKRALRVDSNLARRALANALRENGGIVFDTNPDNCAQVAFS